VVVEVHEPGALASVPPHEPGPAGTATPESPRVAKRSRPADARPAAVAGRLPHVSYTALATFARCPYKHYVTRLLGLAAPKPPVPSATEIGAAVHRRLSVRIERAPSGQEPTTSPPTHGLGPAELARVASAVDGFVGSSLAKELLDHELVAAETPFAVPVGETLLVGAMDALGTTGARALVVDYKTGAHPDGREAAADVHRLQAGCYALAALTGGADDVEVAFAYVEHDVEPVRFHFTEADRHELARDLEERGDAMTGGPFAPLEAYESVACGDCPACGGICPVSAPPRRRRS
jgi:CRISPR/Cas system-associated exonuclease Cas4 (RecB family)